MYGFTVSGRKLHRQGLLLVEDHAIVREALKRVLEPLAAEWIVT